MLTTSVSCLSCLAGGDAASRAAKLLVRTRLVPRVRFKSESSIKGLEQGELSSLAPGPHLKPLPSLPAG